MPRASVKSCSALGGTCPQPALPGHARCADHERQRGQGSSVRQKNPWDWVWKDPRWERLSAHTLREEPRCRICGAPSEVADHIIELADGGQPFDRAGVQALCRACNTAKGQRSTQKRKKARAEARAS